MHTTIRRKIYQTKTYKFFSYNDFHSFAITYSLLISCFLSYFHYYSQVLFTSLFSGNPFPNLSGCSSNPSSKPSTWTTQRTPIRCIPRNISWRHALNNLKILNWTSKIAVRNSKWQQLHVHPVYSKHIQEISAIYISN